MPAELEPISETLFGRAELTVCNAHLLETERSAPAPDIARKRR
jgi:hypothetical protein